MKRLFALIVASFALSIAARTVCAASLALNFAATDPDAATSSVTAGPAGVLGTANWNNLENASGSQANLIDDSGAVTTASVEWTSNNTWRSGGRNLGSGGHAQLMSGYLDYLDNPLTPPVITVTGLDSALGAPSYQVYVYVQGDSADSRSGEWSVNGNALPLTDDQPFSAANEYVLGENYLLFSGITGDEIVVTSMATFRAPINGVEIVGVPEPSSLLLLAVVGLVAGAARRRR